MGLKQLVKHRVKAEKATKAEKREIAEQIEAFDTAIGRLGRFGQAATIIGPLGRGDVEQLIIAATKGAGAITIPAVRQALLRASALRSAHPAGATIDTASGLTTTDLDLVAATASETLIEASAAADAARRERTTGLLWVAAAFIVVIGVVIALVRS